MTTIFLIRHATNDLVGKALAGRLNGIHLNTEGRKQAEHCSGKLSRESISQIFSSPMERAIETAAPLSKTLGLEVKISNGLTEIDFGDWTGKTFDQLALVPKWQQRNSFRSGTRIPGGELISEVQTRMVKVIEQIRADFPSEHIAVFSHADPIKAVLFIFWECPWIHFRALKSALHRSAF